MTDLLRGDTSRPDALGILGRFVGIEPIGADRAEDVAAPRLTAKLGLVEHLRELASLLVLLDGLKQRSARQHHHAVAETQMFLGAIYNRVHGFLYGLILQRNADDSSVAL